MKSLIVILTMLLSKLAFAESEYAPSNNDRIILNKVKSDNDNEFYKECFPNKC